MTTQHTSGPWQATANETSGHYGPSWSIRIATGTAQDRRIVIAGIHGAALHGGAENAEANARLIAAAPELLDALIAALPYVECAIDDRCHKNSAAYKIVCKMCAAIAKAEGR